MDRFEITTFRHVRDCPNISFITWAFKKKDRIFMLII